MVRTLDKSYNIMIMLWALSKSWRFHRLEKAMYTITRSSCLFNQIWSKC